MSVRVKRSVLIHLRAQLQYCEIRRSGTDGNTRDGVRCQRFGRHRPNYRLPVLHQNDSSNQQFFGSFQHVSLFSTVNKMMTRLKGCF